MFDCKLVSWYENFLGCDFVDLVKYFWVTILLTWCIKGWRCWGLSLWYCYSACTQVWIILWINLLSLSISIYIALPVSFTVTKIWNTLRERPLILFGITIIWILWHEFKWKLKFPLKFVVSSGLPGTSVPLKSNISLL